MKAYTFFDYATQGYLALTGLLILSFHNATVPAWGVLVGGHLLAMVLIHALIRSEARGQPGRALSLIRRFYPILLYAAFYAETGLINRMFITHYLDPIVIGWEQAIFGCQPSVIFMQKLPFLALSEVFYFCYFSYYLMIGGVGMALYLRNRGQYDHYVSVVSFVFYFCYLCYVVLPVIGPPVFFKVFNNFTLPTELQRLATSHVYPTAVTVGPFFRLMALIYRGSESPGAALPSSHVAIAVTTVYFSFRYLRSTRFMHFAAAILLCLSTVYCRYHYALDVLTGFATAAVLIPVGNWLFFRTKPLLETKSGQRAILESEPLAK